MNRFPVVVFLVAAVSSSTLAFVADDPPKKLSDAEITKLIVGKWAVEEMNLKGTEHYKNDGTVVAEATIDTGKKPPLKFTVSGTWKVTDGVVTTTVAKSSAPELIKVGQVNKDKVITIDGNVYKYKPEQGSEKTQKRVKE